MLPWFYYRGSEHDRRSSLANQWNTYRDFNRLLCIADPAGRLGRSLTSWPEYSRNLEGFFVGTNQSLAGRPHPPEHLAVWNTSVRNTSSGTLPSGRSHLEHHSPEITWPHYATWASSGREASGATLLFQSERRSSIGVVSFLHNGSHVPVSQTS
jgi:hypothetical protein